jgi:hypothetical protein
MAHPTFLAARNNPDDATPGQHDDEWHDDLGLARTGEGHAISQLRPAATVFHRHCLQAAAGAAASPTVTTSTSALPSLSAIDVRCASGGRRFRSRFVRARRLRVRVRRGCSLPPRMDRR